jgi:hypothetical protein
MFSITFDIAYIEVFDLPVLSINILEMGVFEMHLRILISFEDYPCKP